MKGSPQGGMMQPDNSDMQDKIKAMRAIRLKCLDCSGGSDREVEECPVEQCPLYGFRLGLVPKMSRGKKTEKDQSRKLSLPGL